MLQALDTIASTPEAVAEPYLALADTAAFRPRPKALAPDPYVPNVQADTVFHPSIDYALAQPPIAYVEAVADTVAVAEPPAPPAWESGLEGMPRHTTIGNDSGVLAIVSCVTLLMMLSYRRCRRLFATLWQELVGMRRRANAFDEHTSGEAYALVLMGAQLSVCMGLLLYSAVGAGGTGGILGGTAKLIALAGGYYLVQLCAYSAIGYVFSDREGERLYVQGFTASQSLLGIALVVPALVAIFYPAASAAMAAVGAGLYILARIMFIIKGFKIFYTNFATLLYFILYLCALEIIPLIILCKLAQLLVVSAPMT